MGFGVVCSGILGLIILYCIFQGLSQDETRYLAGFGFGASSIALFARVGGGIYTKAADVGADLAGKVDNAIPEDSPKNPATIADNVGDNVGDIAGMGSDLFGSFAEGTCAAMVIMASSNNCVFYADGAMNPMVSRWSSMCFPIAITATGLVVSFITSLFATHCGEVETEEVDTDDTQAMSKTTGKVEYALKKQLCISTMLMTPVIFLIAALMLPETFWVEARIGQYGTAPSGNTANHAVCEGTVFPPIKQIPMPYPITTLSNGKPFTAADFTGKHCLGTPDSDGQEVQWWQVAFTVTVGLWAGLVIGFVTEYYTSNTYQPVKEVADSCEKGAAVNIIYGLALGYKSAVVPCIALAISIYVGYGLAKMLGVACAALGMLSTMAICLTIDGYGPIADNAGGIAEMAELPARVRHLTDSLDAAGNTTAAIGKGFAIGSAAMVALALFSGYCVRADIKNHDVSVLEPMTFFGLLIGSMMPYAFSAMTMKSVGLAAEGMVDKVREQFRSEVGKAILAGTLNPKDVEAIKELQKKHNDDTCCDKGDWYGPCIKVATDCSLREMIAPGALVMLSPLVMGILFGKYALSGLLVGGITSGVQMAISASNTGGAWDNAKKQIEQQGEKGTAKHMAAVVGDTVGDPLKDTSGPAVNILMKLMAIISLVIGPFVASTRGGYGLIGCSLNKACK